MIRTIIAFVITRILITILSIDPPNDFVHDWFITLPRWLSVVLFFPIKANDYCIIAIPMQICWYAMLVLSLLEYVFEMSLGLAMLIMFLLTAIVIFICGIYVIKKR